MTDLDPQRSRLCGVGLGLRWEFLDDVLAASPGEIDVAFFEVSPENYMRRGGWYPAALERVRERHPIVTHGLTMSLGAVEDPPSEYLNALKLETERLGTPWHSDHLCFSTAGGRVLHELLPLQLSRENVTRVADRVRRMEDRLGLPMAIENVTWYAHPGRQELPEAEFVRAILERADCGLLLDVNNVWVNAQNHGFDARAFVAQLPLERVVQMHVAGHTRTSSGLIVDTHGAPVVDPVLELLEWTLERTGPVPVLLERDNAIPELPELLQEVAKLADVYRRATARKESLARTA
jgi:uncharacterized protein (UPF0276 family)